MRTSTCTRLWNRAWTTMLAALFGLGCGGQFRVDSGSVHNGSTACSDDSECASGICREGTCVPEEVGCSPTNPNGECGNGSVCVEGACLPKAFSDPCMPERPFGRCPDGQRCDGRACVDASTAETCSAQALRGLCPPMQTCQDGLCVQISVDDICAADNPAGVCPSATACSLGQCVPQECGNGVLEPTESCDGEDLGTATCETVGTFTGGELRCGEDCAFVTDDCTVCGDGVRNGNEPCDGTDLGELACPDFESLSGVAFSGGTLLCDQCQVDTTDCFYCGDGVQNPGESCDGGVGSTTCADVLWQQSPDIPYDGGILLCSDTCQLDASRCHVCGDGEAEGPEWCEPGPPEDLRGASCATLFMQGGTLACDPGCYGFDTSRCGVASLAIAPPISALQVALGSASTQQFSATVTYNDSSSETVAVTWSSNNPAAGSISAAGLFTTSPTLTSNAGIAVMASYGGQTTTLVFFIDVTEPTAVCGDGVIDATEDCESGVAITSDCTTVDPLLIDGTLRCNPDDCTFDTAACVLDSCGDGEPDDGEECDDGANGDPDDGCTDLCRFPTCGDGFAQASLGEECDDGNLDVTDACLDTPGAECKNAFCGDGIRRVDKGPSDADYEQCDGVDLAGQNCGTLGYRSGTLGCTAACSFETSGCSDDAGDPLAGLTQIDLVCTADGSTCPPDGIRISYGATGAPTVDFDAIGTFAGGPQRDITGLVTWSLNDPAGGAYDSDLGAFDPVSGELIAGGGAGTFLLVAAARGLQAIYEVQVVVDAHFVVVDSPEDDIDLPLPVPADAPDFFAEPQQICSPPTAADRPVVVYPHDGTLFPRNIYQVLFQWIPSGNGLFKARFDNDATDTHLAVYTTADRWRPTEPFWRLLTLSNAGGSVTFSVDAVPYTGTESPGGCYQQTLFSVEIRFSAADVPGAVYYWSTAVAGVKKAQINNRAPLNFVYGSKKLPPGAGAGSNYTLTPGDAEWPYSDSVFPHREPDGAECIACHAVSRDGRQLAAVGKFGKDSLTNYDLSGSVSGVTGEIDFEIDPTGLDCKEDPGPLCEPAWMTYNDTGDKIAVVGKKNGGRLRLLASSGGATLGDDDGFVPTGVGPNGWTATNHPDWSPGGRWLAFVYSDRATRDGDDTGAVAVFRFDRDAFAQDVMPGPTDTPWGAAPWPSPVVLVNAASGLAEGVTEDPSNWYFPAFSPDGLWLVLNRMPEGEKTRQDESGASPALLYVLKWAECERDADNQCPPHPICTASGTESVCGKDGDEPCDKCVPVPLTALNTLYSNCDHVDSPAYPCESPPTHQTNMARWAPTNRPDVYFLVFTTHRPYGKVSGATFGSGGCDAMDPPASCYQEPTVDQLWVSGFDGTRSPDPSFPPFWLPFQELVETNHRAYWSHDIACLDCGGCDATVEICDGLDNDCDGVVDEGCCVPTCPIEGEEGCEQCDGEDNDCDGLIDERDSPTGPVPGGLCCEVSAEVCDGVDNDCDGLVDEGCNVCTPTDEICDLLDNDCDDLVDETDADLWSHPAAGCPVTSPDDPLGPDNCPCCGEEVCDGIDNDCDGLVDDADPDVAFPGYQTCCFPAADDPCNGVDDDCNGIIDDGCCVPDVPPIEICDGRDNNCNGLVDEEELGAGACCRDDDGDGYDTCAPDADCDDTDPDINPGMPEQLCSPLCYNGIDDNCDGVVDDCVCEG